MNPEKQKFFEQLKGAAMEQQIKYGIPASVTLAQAWIEPEARRKTKVRNTIVCKADLTREREERPN